MPMFKVKLKPLHPDHDMQVVRVWADDARAAGVQAIKVARSLLKTNESFEIFESVNLSPGGKGAPERPHTPRVSPHGPVFTRFIET